MCKEKDKTKTKVDQLIQSMDRLAAALEKANQPPEVRMREEIKKIIIQQIKDGEFDKTIASQYGLYRG